MQIGLARLLQKPHDVHHVTNTIQGVLQLSVSAACTSSDMRMQEYTAKKHLIGK